MRPIIAVAAALVVVAAIVLGIELSSSSSEPSTTRTPDRPTDPTIGERPRPALADQEPGQGGTPTTEPRRSRLRDHRDTSGPYDPAGRTENRTAQRLSPDLVRSLSAQLEAVMLECTTTSTRGPAPVVNGTVFVDVAGGALQVTEASIELRDLDDAAKQCMQARWVGQTAPAPQGVSATHYEISVVFAVPSR